MPSRLSVSCSVSMASSRSVIRSPCVVGSVAVRKWILRSSGPSFCANRPSWAIRRSAMSIRESTLKRPMSAPWTDLGNLRNGSSCPSTRSCTSTMFSSGSMWMSDALRSKAVSRISSHSAMMSVGSAQLDRVVDAVFARSDLSRLLLAAEPANERAERLAAVGVGVRHRRRRLDRGGHRLFEAGHVGRDHPLGRIRVAHAMGRHQIARRGPLLQLLHRVRAVGLAVADFEIPLVDHEEQGAGSGSREPRQEETFPTPCS